MVWWLLVSRYLGGLIIETEKNNCLFTIINCVVWCTTQPSNDTNNMLETKTYLYSYDYETEPNGELSTAYHEEKTIC